MTTLTVMTVMTVWKKKTVMKILKLRMKREWAGTNNSPGRIYLFTYTVKSTLIRWCYTLAETLSLCQNLCPAQSFPYLNDAT
jgi:hypothetical protein